mmetsp:Transcript_30371/g.83652  ORF Transcript_30371/g.83652 Transcript_30371/m.83652 type:complete len:215 (+) Transcript_30371:594-1238(+)
MIRCRGVAMARPGHGCGTNCGGPARLERPAHPSRTTAQSGAMQKRACASRNPVASGGGTRTRGAQIPGRGSTTVRSTMTCERCAPQSLRTSPHRRSLTSTSTSCWTRWRGARSSSAARGGSRATAVPARAGNTTRSASWRPGSAARTGSCCQSPSRTRLAVGRRPSRRSPSRRRRRRRCCWCTRPCGPQDPRGRHPVGTRPRPFGGSSEGHAGR